MRESDMNTISGGVASTVLMQKAAEGIFKSVTWQSKVLIVCGSGNNAGDGYALAPMLKKSGTECEILCISSKFSPDGKYYFDKCIDLGITILQNSEKVDFSSYKIIVDCIFGTGFKGDIPENIAPVIQKINASTAYKVSCDINSGLNSDTGMSKLCVKSDLTVSIGTYKLGHFLNMAKDVIKEKSNCDIGIEIIGEKYHLIEKDDIKICFPERKNFSNKGTYGYVTLIGGCREYSGAIKLANLSLSSLKVGAGVAKLAVPEEIAPSVMPYMLESTLLPLKSYNGYVVFDKEKLDEIIKSSRVICLGMGFGQGGDNEKIIEYILKNYDSVFIIDADGLNSLAKSDKEILKNSKCKVILTPHIMEFSRLSGYSKDEIFENSVDLAKRYAKETGVTLLLKGTSTIITDGVRVFITDKGSPSMATAGSGDVLSGIICGICSQNINGDILLNVACGAYVNGRSGELAAENVNTVSALSSDTVSAIPTAISEIIK
jgi:NAD(P)H-hydrate epimerase